MDSSLKLDTSGAVMVEFAPGCDQLVTWDRLSPFTQGALTAALEGVDTGDGEDGCYWMARFSDLSPETMAFFIEFGSRWEQSQATEAEGRLAWDFMQAGKTPGWPPAVLFVGADGLIHHRPRTETAS